MATQQELDAAHERIQGELATLMQHARDAAARDAAIMELAGQIPGLRQQVSDLKDQLAAATAAGGQTFDTSGLEEAVAEIDKTVQSIAPAPGASGGESSGTAATGGTTSGTDPAASPAAGDTASAGAGAANTAEASSTSGD